MLKQYASSLSSEHSDADIVAFASPRSEPRDDLSEIGEDAGATAQTAIYSLGVGRLSCNYWLSSPERENEGRSWALGFWTAYNALNDVNHTVGVNTDTEAIFDEAKKICASEPSLELVDAIVRVYVRLLHDGK